MLAMAQEEHGEQAGEEQQQRMSIPPVLMIVYFHKAIRLELERIHCTALAVDKGSQADFDNLVDRYDFLREIYEHHSLAEDEVILPALDARVKNVARSYTLEHIVENDLFHEISQLLSGSESDICWKEIICCTEAIQTTLCQHLFKEENQVLPLLMQYFTHEEQSSLVWQFMGNIPIKLMEILLPWLASCLSKEECQRMLDCIDRIVPADDLLQQVISDWFKQDRSCFRLGGDRSIRRDLINAGRACGRKADELTNSCCPINDLLHWHKAIKGELHEIAEDIKVLHSNVSSSSTALNSLHERMEFLSKVWSFHSAAEDRFVFPALGKKVNHEDHACGDALRMLASTLKESMDENTLAQADVVLDAVNKHFLYEETEFIPLACKLCSVEEQRNLVYEGLRSMPLTFLKRVLPWIVRVVTDKEAKDMLVNMRLAAPKRDKSLVALLTGWACENHSNILDLLNSDVLNLGKRNCPATLDRPLKHYRLPTSCRYLGSGKGSSSDEKQHCKPIDQIFQVHRAIRKDLEYLDAESGRLVNCSDEFLGQFSGRFYFLWGLYRAHSNAEDTIVFPALEAKEALLNVSHSYMIDHRQEEDLFVDIAAVLAKFSQEKKDEQETCEFADKLQRMCKTVRICLGKHVDKEESELWPLFDQHFSVKEQEKVMARIIGSTGAEMIQAMLPWVTAVLTEEEQTLMMETWQQVTRKTLFMDWLGAWWKISPLSSATQQEQTSPVPDATPAETLQELAEYLSSNTGTEGEDFKSSEASSSTSTQAKSENFKPGWPEIFRLNQEELEAAVRKVSRDSSLDPRRKAYLMQNLMTSRWMAAQQKMRNQQTESECRPSFADEENSVFGCRHYRRNCKLRPACCGSLFTCRFCHDEASDHTMNRYQTKEMMCMQCLQIQPVGPCCVTPSCGGYSMGSYYCKICKFFSDDNRKIYHCPFCNLCRVGTGLGVDFFHCLVCNGCMAKSMEETHVCRENGVETNCPICFDFIFGSVSDVRSLKCGHYMHTACFRAYTSGHYTCPICCKTMGDMAIYFEMLDALLAVEQLPEEYRERQQAILCNDCERKGLSKFHWVYHKCSFCGSYNTKTI